MNEVVKTILIALIPSLFSSIGAYLVALKNLNTSIKTMKENNKHEIDRLMEQHKLDIESLKEEHELEMKMKDKDHAHKLEIMEKEHQNELIKNDKSRENDVKYDVMEDILKNPNKAMDSIRSLQALAEFAEELGKKK